MLDLVQLMLFMGSAILIFVGAALGGFIASMVYGFFGYSAIEKRLISLENSYRGQKGVEIRGEKAEQLQAAMLEAAAIFKEDIPQEEKTKKLIAVGMKNPAVMMDLVKKFGKGGLSGLI